MDLLTAPRSELIKVIHEKDDRITNLETQIIELKSQIDELKRENTQGKKKIFKASIKKKETKPKKVRDHGYSRNLDIPTHKIFHSLQECPDCGDSLGKPTVSYSRQIIEIPKTPVRITEHIIFKRYCFHCHKQFSPKVNLKSQVVSKHRMGIRLMSLIGVLRDRCRLPFGVIQTYLKLVHNLKLSEGEIVEVCHTIAKAGKEDYDNLFEEVRASPVIHADETGGREDGRNGYFWSMNTPKVHVLLYRHSRSAKVVQELLPEEKMTKDEAVLVTDFYAAYNEYTGFHQRCWVHLFRDIKELEEKYPKDEDLKSWSDNIHTIYQEAKSYQGSSSNLPNLPKGLKQQERINKTHYFEQKLLSNCQSYIKTISPQAILCARIAKYLPELFTFIRFEGVPSDNNNAERILRHTVIQRKISGGTRSAKGSETRSILTSLFDTWQLQGLNPLLKCQLLLANYH